MSSENMNTKKEYEESLLKRNLTNLPSELLLRIFSFLSHSDLNKTILVCRKFRDLASDPVLWKMFSISAMKISLHSGLDRLLKVLNLPRFKKLEVLDLNRVHPSIKKTRRIQPQDSELMEILKVASRLPLTWLDLSYNNLPGLVSPDFLTKLILNIPHVDLFATRRVSTSDFVGNILENFKETSALHTINLGGCHLDNLPIYLITKLNFMTGLAFERVIMTVKQAEAFMLSINKGTKIKKFDIGYETIGCIRGNGTLCNMFKKLEPDLVASALNNVEYLVYNKMKYNYTIGHCSDFPPDLHLASLLQVMGGNDTKLKQVEMEYNNFSHVSLEVVAKAFNNLEHLVLKPYITSEQIVAVLELMAKQTRLKSLKLVFGDLSWLNAGLLARAVVQVEQVDVVGGLARVHVRTILAQIFVDKESRTRRLNLAENDVSQVPNHILETAVKFLRRDGGVAVLIKKGKKLCLGYKN